ncbi:hypothetical protein GGD66_007060 [Bradyrhizobium sp. CIR48]|nr:hypothetical protein [Bradyrhizobium sp. CIR48]
MRGTFRAAATAQGVTSAEREILPVGFLPDESAGVSLPSAYSFGRPRAAYRRPRRLLAGRLLLKPGPCIRGVPQIDRRPSSETGQSSVNPSTQKYSTLPKFGFVVCVGHSSPPKGRSYVVSSAGWELRWTRAALRRSLRVQGERTS